MPACSAIEPSHGLVERTSLSNDLGVVHIGERMLGIQNEPLKCIKARMDRGDRVATTVAKALLRAAREPLSIALLETSGKKTP